MQIASQLNVGNFEHMCQSHRQRKFRHQATAFGAWNENRMSFIFHDNILMTQKRALRPDRPSLSGVTSVTAHGSWMIEARSWI